MSPETVLKILIWPVLILVLCIIFRGPISDLIRPSPSQTVTVKVGLSGVEISRVAAAAAAVAAGTAARADQGVPLNQTTLAANLAHGIEASLAMGARGDNHRRLLWVDDVPSNNEYLAKAFSELGIDVVIAKSTDEAKKLLSNTHFDLLISDMSRPPDGEAGLTLLRYLKDQGNRTPVIIYAGQWPAEHRGQESAIGAGLITNDPSEVYSTVLKRLLRPG
jgi:CheY-like chemotaxis protein